MLYQSDFKFTNFRSFLYSLNSYLIGGSMTYSMAIVVFEGEEIAVVEFQQGVN